MSPRRTSVAAALGLACLLVALPLEATPTPRSPSQGGGGVERYRIDGSPSADGCGGQVYLAARHIVLDRARNTLFADVVRRTYGARFEAERVQASGRFTSPTTCSGALRESWDLRRTGPDELRGTLSSTWQLPPSCEPCTITFRIRATRAR